MGAKRDLLAANADVSTRGEVDLGSFAEAALVASRKYRQRTVKT